jgi:hypothetical protein
MAASLPAPPADGIFFLAGQVLGPVHAVGAIVPLAIAVLGVFLLLWHRRTWRAVEAAGATDTEELAFQRRRYRRRLRTSGLLVVLGIALEGGQWIVPARHPSFFVFYWFGVAVLATWMMMLAAADAFATRLHVRDELRRQAIERAKLNAELTRLKTTESTNGHRPG